MFMFCFVFIILMTKDCTTGVNNESICGWIHTVVLDVQMHELTLGLYEAPAVITLVARGSPLLAVD